MTEEIILEINLKEWDPTYDNYLLKTANTAEVVCNWNLLRELIRIKIKQLCEQKMADNQSNQIINGESIEEFQMRIWAILDSFDEPPFTIQRLCELTTISHEQHKTVWKYLRAIEKVLLVTSCITSNGMEKNLSMDMMTHFESNIKSKNLIDPLKVKIENPDLDTIFANTKAPSSIPNNNSEENKDTKMKLENSDDNNKQNNKMEINENESNNELNRNKSNENENNSTNSSDMDISQ